MPQTDTGILHWKAAPAEPTPAQIERGRRYSDSPRECYLAMLDETVGMPIPGVAQLLALHEQACRMHHAVEQSRGANNYARNEGAVAALVETRSRLEDTLRAVFAAWARRAGTEPAEADAAPPRPREQAVYLRRHGGEWIETRADDPEGQAFLPATGAQAPLRPIRTEFDHRAATAEISALMALEPPAGSPEGDRLEVLALLAQAYEDRHFPIPA